VLQLSVTRQLRGGAFFSQVEWRPHEPERAPFRSEPILIVHACGTGSGRFQTPEQRRSTEQPRPRSTTRLCLFPNGCVAFVASGKVFFFSEVKNLQKYARLFRSAARGGWHWQIHVVSPAVSSLARCNETASAPPPRTAGGGWYSSKAMRAPDATPRPRPRAQRNARTGRKASAACGRRRRICIDPYVPEGKQLLVSGSASERLG